MVHVILRSGAVFYTENLQTDRIHRQCIGYAIHTAQKGVVAMAQVNIRIDDALKEEGERLFGELGLNFSTAVSIFVRQSVREGGIPFVIKLQDTDPFYSEGNIRHLLKVKADVDAGRNIVIRDLIEG